MLLFYLYLFFEIFDFFFPNQSNHVAIINVDESVFAFLHNRLFSKQEPHVKLVADARVSQPLPNAQTPGVCNVVLVTVTPMNTLFYYRINIDYMICCSFS